MITQTIRTVGGLDRTLRTLFWTTLIFRAGTMAYPFLSAYLLLSGRISTGRAGFIVAAFGVGALIADLSAGVVLGRVSARAAIVFGLVLNAVILVVVPPLRDTGALIPAVLVWGLAFELYTPASYTAIVQMAPPDERKIAFSCHRLAINLGMGVGPALGGLLFALNPLALFWANAVFVLAAALNLLVRTRRLPGIGAAGAAEPAKPRGRLVAASWREETRFWTFFGLSLPIQFAYSLPPVFASTYVIIGLGMPSYWVGVIFTLNAAVIVLTEIPLNTLMARVAHLPTLVSGYALTGAGFLLMGVSHTPVALIAATLVWTAGEMIVFPGMLTYASALSAPEVSARNMSLYSAGVNVALIATPQLALLLSGSGHPALPWIAAGSAVCLALLLMLAARTSDSLWYAPSDQAAPEAELVTASHTP